MNDSSVGFGPAHKLKEKPFLHTFTTWEGRELSNKRRSKNESATQGTIVTFVTFVLLSLVEDACASVHATYTCCYPAKSGNNKNIVFHDSASFNLRSRSSLSLSRTFRRNVNGLQELLACLLL